jgi:hypothetical protein
VPEAVVGGRGVEYWVEVETATRTLTDPPAAPSDHPKRLQVTLSSVAEASSHAGEQYRMVSFPVSFDESFTGTIEDLLIDEKGFGEYNAERWRSWAWVTGKGYGELNDPTMAKLFRPVPGRAFWLVSKEEHRVDTGPVVGKSTPTGAPYEITLKPGWTMIGDPFAFAVAWSGVLSDATPADEDTLLSGPYGYGGTGYRKKDRLEPFLGYWLHNDHAGEITLHVPPVEAPITVAMASGRTQTGGWSVHISARSGEARDEAELGVAADARDGRDRYDELEPPMSPDRSVSVYAIDDAPRSLDRRDAASWLRDGGVIWALDIAKNFASDRAGDEVTLAFETTGIPADQRVVLLDRKLGREIDLRRTLEYALVLGEHSVAVRNKADARFVLLVGSDVYLAAKRDLLPGLPTQTVLHQNTPNPFNPSTVIRYDLAAPASVALRIYDLHGALVKNLETGKKPAGRYEVGWNGENERGERVASGVYFYELRAGSFRQTRKMVLLK